jgi:hypothetical protein
LNETKERQTIAGGRNIGALHSDGEILIFLNADARISDVETFFKLCDNLFKMPSIVALAFEVNVIQKKKI